MDLFTEIYTNMNVAFETNYEMTMRVIKFTINNEIFMPYLFSAVTVTVTATATETVTAHLSLIPTIVFPHGDAFSDDNCRR